MKKFKPELLSIVLIRLALLFAVSLTLTIYGLSSLKLLGSWSLISFTLLYLAGLVYYFRHTLVTPDLSLSDRALR